MFKEMLKGILERTEGSLGALIMGTDGISVEQLLAQRGTESNLDVVAAEITSLVRGAQRTGRDVGLGKLKELIVAFENSQVVLRLLTAEYFLALAMDKNGNLGRGRFELRKAELQLAREFAV